MKLHRKRPSACFYPRHYKTPINTGTFSTLGLKVTSNRDTTQTSHGLQWQFTAGALGSHRERQAVLERNKYRWNW